MLALVGAALHFEKRLVELQKNIAKLNELFPGGCIERGISGRNGSVGRHFVCADKLCDRSGKNANRGERASGGSVFD